MPQFTAIIGIKRLSRPTIPLYPNIYNIFLFQNIDLIVIPTQIRIARLVRRECRDTSTRQWQIGYAGPPFLSQNANI